MNKIENLNKFYDNKQNKMSISLQLKEILVGNIKNRQDDVIETEREFKNSMDSSSLLSRIKPIVLKNQLNQGDSDNKLDFYSLINQSIP